MVALNGQVNLPQLQKVMMEFQKQSEMMDMKQEVVGDAIDDAMDNEEDVEESEAVVSQVLDELGVQMSEGLVDAPGNIRHPLHSFIQT
jgi:charged multivesicular body protein 2A